MKTVLPINPEPLFVSRYESAVITDVIQANAENAGKDINPWLSGLMANYHHSTGFLWQLDHLSKLGENDMKYSDILRKITGIVFFHSFTKTIDIPKNP